MAGNLNKVLLIGNITRDLELRYISSGTAVLDMGVAVNRRVKQQDGTWADEVAFIDVTVWGRTAESCAEYLSKGRSVFVEGHLRLDKWQDKKTGENRSKLRVTAENVQFLGGRGESGGGDGGGRSGGGRPSPPPPQQQQQQAPPQQQGPPDDGAAGGSNLELNDDDIPF
jgi:single-strand DNA-binding protein